MKMMATCYVISILVGIIGMTIWAITDKEMRVLMHVIGIAVLMFSMVCSLLR